MKPQKRSYRHLYKGLSGKWVLTISISIGIIAGVCFWLFISRCEEKDCFFHFFPLVEMFIGGFIGTTFPLIQWSEKF